MPANPLASPTNASVVSDLAMFPEMNPGPVIRTDEGGMVLLANAAARELFSLSPTPGNTRWTDICPGCSPEFWARVLAGADRLQHESALGERVFTFTYRRPPGIPSIFIYGNDITERKRAEVLLAEQTERVAALARFPDLNPGPLL